MKKSLINTKMLIGISVALIMSSAGLMVHGQQTCFSCPKVSEIADKPYTSDTCPTAKCQWDSTMNGWKWACCAVDWYWFDTKCWGKPPINSFSYVWNGEWIIWSHEYELDGKSDVPSNLTNSSCIYGCKEGYSYINIGVNGKCVSTQLAECIWEFPANAVTGNSLTLQSKEWHYNEDSNVWCSFTCKSGYEWDGEKCEKIETQPQKWFYQFMNIDKLTIGIWNSIMEKLDEILTRSDDGVPSWAIMAFALDECPSGWRRFGEADGRFLRWASSYGATWWNSEIKLNANQLPAHQHVYKDTVYSEDSKWSSSYINLWNTDIPGNDKTILWNAGSTDENNYPVYWYRATVNGICTGKSSSQLLNGSSCSTTQKTIDITNPYLNVIYCVKQ